MNAAHKLIGYGPNAHLLFSGDAEDFDRWSVKFKGMIRLQGLNNTLDGTENPPSGENNAKLYALLVQCLDDKSLDIIIRDADNQGKEAYDMLVTHYVGASKPRIISQYLELTTLIKSELESITEYVIRAETAAARLKQAGEQISEKLLIAMIIKGLPESFRPFTTIINSVDDIKFSKFKSQLRDFEENEAARTSHMSNKDDVYKLTCHQCGVSGHIAPKCPRRRSQPQNLSSSRQGQGSRPSLQKRTNKWCDYCRTRTHNTEYCFKKPKNSKSHDENYRKSKSYNVSNNDECHDDDLCFKIIDGESIFSLNNNENYLIDCGATCHILCDPSKFITKDENFNPDMHTIELANNTRQTGVATMRGNAVITLNDIDGKPRQVTIKQALCIPSYKQNILSVHCMTQSGTKVNFAENECLIIMKNGIKFPISQSGRLYFVHSINDTCNKTKLISKSLENWHYTLGHCNSNDIVELEKKVESMKITDKTDYECDYCTEAKMTNKINRQPDPKATKPLFKVHTDLCGPIKPISLKGSRYALVFVDDFSGMIVVYFIKQKSDAVRATAKFLADMAPYGVVSIIATKVAIIRSDSGGEFVSKQYEDLLIENKIAHEFSSPHSPHQNGTAERAFRTLFETARAMAFQAGLPKNLWSYALRHAAFVRNRCYSQTHKNTPYEKFTGKSPQLEKLHVFGTKCHALIQNPSKLDSRTQVGQYVGKDPHSPAHLIYISKSNSVIRARNVQFSSLIPHRNSQKVTFECERGYYPIIPDIDEADVQSPPASQVQPNSGASICGGGPTTAAPKPHTQAAKVQPVQIENSHVNQGGNLISGEHPSGEIPNSITGNVSARPKRNRKPPAYLAENYVVEPDHDDNDLFHDATYSIDYFCKISNIPSTYDEALNSDEASNWQNAMQTEYNSLIEMQTFDIVPKPKDNPVIGGRWVFAMKNNEHSETIYKARYVAKGFSQIPSLNYSETFSPTARFTSIRTLCQVAINENMKMYHIDVKTAYLNAPIDHTIYVSQPKGFEQFDENGNKLVLKLNRSLYGLKQSGRLWNMLLHDFLISMGFTQSISDYCVYVINQNESKVILILWVDDIILATSSEITANKIKTSLSNRFKMKDFGQISNFLGIKFQISENFITLDQSEYVEKMLLRFGMLEAHERSIPCDLSTAKLDFNDDSPLLENVKLYQEIVGSLIYLVTCTRPDIAYVVSILAQSMSKPTMAHLKLAKFVLRYLKGTKFHGLIYRKCTPIDIIGYTDASWANGMDRKSISGYCFMMHKNSSLISWKTKKQSVVALSTCESEYIGMAFAIQEAVFLQNLLCDFLVFHTAHPVKLHVDNMGSIDLAKNPVFHNRSKHIDTKYHYIRSKISDGSIHVCYVSSKENIADVFTKPCTKQALSKFQLCKPV